MFIYKMNGMNIPDDKVCTCTNAMRSHYGIRLCYIVAWSQCLFFFFFFFLALLALNWVLPKSVNQILLVLMFHKIGDLILFGITPFSWNVIDARSMG
jgi:hypothetical protein